MFRKIIVSLLLFVPSYLLCQENINIDSVVKGYGKAYKKNIKSITNHNDSSLLLIWYNKKTYEVVGVQLLMDRPYTNNSLPRAQYSWIYYPNEIVLIKVIANHSDNKHLGHARYLFQNGILLSKEEDKYIERDYSRLFGNSRSYKQIAYKYLNQKLKK